MEEREKECIATFVRIVELEKRFKLKESWTGYAQWLSELLTATNKLPSSTASFFKKPLQNHLKNLLVKCIIVK